MFVRNCIPGLLTMIFLWGCQKQIDPAPETVNQLHQTTTGQKLFKDLQQVNLVANSSTYQPLNINAHLVNAWGIAFGTSGPAWVTSFGGNKSLILTSSGAEARPAVDIPTHTASSGGHPTGIVFNSSATDFLLPNGNAARFIFAEADGLISAWNSGNEAVKKIDEQTGAVYLGLALATNDGNSFLYAANFSQGKIDVFNSKWEKVNMSFTDPNLPEGYLPLNIQQIDGKLYVMYGQPGTGDDVISPRNGIIDIFNTDGTFIKRFITQGQLNAPWGITKAPAGFWDNQDLDTDIILVGNFGDGHINAFTADGAFLGQLRSHGNPIVIERLWAIAFAPVTSTSFDHNTLYFAGGPAKEKDGLFGSISK